MKPTAPKVTIISAPRDAQRWLEQWRAAAGALEETRRRELVELSEEQALEMADSLLALGAELPFPEARLRTSGLVEQQAAFHPRRGA